MIYAFYQPLLSSKSNWFYGLIFHVHGTLLPSKCATCGCVLIDVLTRLTSTSLHKILSPFTLTFIYQKIGRHMISRRSSPLPKLRGNFAHYTSSWASLWTPLHPQHAASKKAFSFKSLKLYSCYINYSVHHEVKVFIRLTSMQ